MVKMCIKARQLKVTRMSVKNVYKMPEQNDKYSQRSIFNVR